MRPYTVVGSLCFVAFLMSGTFVMQASAASRTRSQAKVRPICSTALLSRGCSPVCTTATYGMSVGGYLRRETHCSCRCQPIVPSPVPASSAPVSSAISVASSAAPLPPTDDSGVTGMMLRPITVQRPYDDGSALFLFTDPSFPAVLGDMGTVRLWILSEHGWVRSGPASRTLQPVYWKTPPYNQSVTVPLVAGEEQTIPLRRLTLGIAPQSGGARFVLSFPYFKQGTWRELYHPFKIRQSMMQALTVQFSGTIAMQDGLPPLTTETVRLTVGE